MSIRVNVDNFARAETHRMMATLQAQGGGVNRLHHLRAPTPIDNQPVIRMNRDTLYSFAVVDITAGATLTLPDAGDRYVSAMVVNEDHYVDAVFHAAGQHPLSLERFGSPHVVVALRILVDANDPDDIAAVVALQDQAHIESASDATFEPADYDASSLDETRTALLALARNMTDFDRAFGSQNEVDPVRHLIGTAAGWGGLPGSEATYVNAEPGLPVGQYELTVGEVPVDGFWSISMYNADGFFEPNERGANSINNVMAVRNPDGSITVRFGDFPDNVPNVLPLTEGWNYVVRMYRPRAEITTGGWTFPTLNA